MAKKKGEYKMSKKLLASLLAGAMAVSVLPSAAFAEGEVKNPKYYMTDLTQYYEKDTFYHSGELLDEDLIWRNQYNLDRSDLVSTLDDGSTAWKIPKKEIAEVTGADGKVSYKAQATGEYVPFAMTADNFSSHRVVTQNDSTKSGKDTIIIQTTGDGGTAKTIALAQKRAKEVYFLAAATNKSTAAVGLDVDIKYTDGIVETKHINLSEINSNYSVKVGSGYQGDWNSWGTRIYDVLNETTGEYTGGNTGNCWLEFPIYKVDVQTDKTLESVTIRPIQSTDKGVGYSAMLYGITSIPMSNEELQAAIDANTITNVTSANAGEVLKLNTYADELIERNAAVEGDFAEIRALKPDAEYYAAKVDPTEYTVDISEYLDKDTIFGEGDTLNVETAWAGERSLSISESTLATNAAGNTVLEIEERVITKNSDDTYSSSKTGKKIPFLMTANALKGGICDAAAIKTTALTNQALTIPLSGKKSDYLYLLVNSHSGYTVTAEIAYQDGTAESQNIVVPAGQASNENRYSSNYAGHTSGVRMWVKQNEYGTYYATNINNGKADGYAPEVTMIKVDVRADKKLQSITFKPISSTDASWKGNLMLYGITEVPMSNVDMLTAIEENTITEVTAENAQEVAVLDAYATELVERHAVKEDEVSAIRALMAEAEFYLNIEDPAAHTWDISSYYNVDTLADLGDTLGDTWYTTDGADCTNVPAINIKNELTHGVGYVAEKKVVEDSTVTAGYSWQETGRTIPFAINEESLKGGVTDAIFINSSAVNDRVTINAEAAGAKRRAKDIVMLAYSQGTYGYVYFDVEVVYTDGSKEVTNIRTRTARAAENMKDYSATAGLWELWDGNYAIKNDNGVAVKQDGRYPYIGLLKFNVDPTKVIKEISFVCNDDRNGGEVNKLIIYGLTSMTMSNDELKAEIAAAQTTLDADGYTTYKNTELAKAAGSYVYELEARSAAKQSEYTEILAYCTQAAAQEPIYAELAYDADVIATPGDTASLDITADVVDVCDYIDVNGFVTLKAPGNADYASDPEIGRKFKLSGLNAGVDDSVSLQNKSYTLNIGGKILNKIAASVYYSDGLTSAAGSKSCYAVINYSDGTTEELQATVPSTCSYYAGQNYAHISDYAMKWDSDNGKWISSGYSEGVHSVNLTSSVFEPSQLKAIDSITFKEQNDFVAILAVTEVPYTNDEYMDILYAMEDSMDNDTVTEANAQTVYNGTTAAIEMINRGNLLLAEENERYQSLKSTAEKILYGEKGEVVFEKPVITVSDTTVTATAAMKNTTDTDENYILIIAAYNEDNSLVEIKSTTAKTLLKNTESTSDAVSMTIPTNASYYKAFVWKSMESIIPLAYGDYGIN